MASPKPPVLSVIVRRYAPEDEDKVKQCIARIQKAVTTQPGFVDLQNSWTVGTNGNEVLTVFAFDGQAHLDQWLQSPKRTAFVADLDQITMSTASHATFDGLALLQNPKAQLRKIEVVAILIFWILLLGKATGMLGDAVLPADMAPVLRSVLLVSINVLIISYVLLPWSSLAVTKLKAALRG